MLDLNRSVMLAVSICGFDWDDKLIEEQGQNAIKMANGSNLLGGWTTAAFVVC